MKLKAADIAIIVGGELSGPPELVFSEIVTDSRNISISGEKAFFAIRGNNHDGHRFIPGLHKAGIRIFIVEYFPESILLINDSAFIRVDNTIRAIQKLAAFKRASFRNPVIAVTGSAGKTVVKEWIAEIAGQALPVVRSPKSYNSQLGVPLSVWRLEDRFKAAVFEAGISQPGEMKYLKTVLDPDIGILTNIGDAHSENFGSMTEKALEKLVLFRGVRTLIYCSDFGLIDRLIRDDSELASRELIDWSLTGRNAAIKVTKSDLQNGSCRLVIDFRGINHEYRIPFSDRASVENAVSAAAACLVLGIGTELIAKGLETLSPVAMRMEFKAGINNCQLIEDFYNSDPGSLGMALESLKQGNNRKKTLILSDFIQSGRNETELYSEVGGLVKSNGVEKFIGIGPALTRSAEFFEAGSKFYLTTDEFVQKFSASEFSSEIILLKGARKFEFEKIGRLLEQQVHQTLLEVSLDTIASNLGEFRKMLKPGTMIMAMVKAFAYGAGPSEISAFLEYHGVNWLAVAYADEGMELRNTGISIPIMVMNPDPASFGLMISNNLEPEIFSIGSLKGFIAEASKYGVVNYPVHIKIDTGMHRLGFLPEEIPELCLLIKNSEQVRVISVFSHFAASEDPLHDNFTHLQARRFIDAAQKVSEASGTEVIRHICNSAGIIRFPEYQFEMVRPGIGIYGAGNISGLDLKTAGKFITRISQVKKVPAGEPVGYGCADVSDHDRNIAICPVGYADGLSRMMGNSKGNLFIRGKKVPIVGNVCMDMCMADVTGLNAAEGDIAEIFGENISIEEVASACCTIPYEILTSVPSRVKRVFTRS